MFGLPIWLVFVLVPVFYLVAMKVIGFLALRIALYQFRRCVGKTKASLGK